MKRIIISLFLVCCYSIALAGVKLQLESSKVQFGATFALTLSLEGLTHNVVPDFSPLQQDFKILGTESNLNYSIVNGQSHSVSEWTVLLTPKKVGVLSIPALKVGVESTAPTSIEVTEQESIQTHQTTGQVVKVKGQPKDIMLFTEVSVKEPYVNQQVTYTVKLYNSGRLLDASYQPPQVDDALFVPIGSGQRYQVNKDGRLYTVEEQQFALFPQKSGDLTIKPPSFTGLIYDFQPKREKVRGKPTVLKVKPIPTESKRRVWLPAKQVTLSESYDKNTSSLYEGSTLVRTVVLEAVAVPAQLLPKLDFGSSTQFSLYPEKPSDKNVFKQHDLVGTRTIKVTYLLNKAGKITIPPLSVPWFNVETGKEEVSSLPGFTVNVTAVAGATQPIVATKPAVVPAQVIQQNEPKQVITVMAPQNHLAWWLAGGFAIAWLLTLVLWRRQKIKKEDPTLSKNKVLKQLQDACLQNNPIRAKDALLRWGHMQWPETHLLNLIDLENWVTDEALKQQIHLLAEVLYNNHKTTQHEWQGETLWQSVVGVKTDKPKGKKDNPLPPIHRIS